MRVIFLFLLCEISCWGGIRCFRSFCSSAKHRSRSRIGVSASAWLDHWIYPSSGLSGSLALFFGNVIPVGSLALVASVTMVAMEREMWSRCGCHSPCWQHLFLKTIFPSAQLHPKIFPSKQNPSVLRNQGDLVSSVTGNILQ